MEGTPEDSEGLKFLVSLGNGALRSGRLCSTKSSRDPGEPVALPISLSGLPGALGRPSPIPREEWGNVQAKAISFRQLLGKFHM